jgi:uncharacterized protein involved in outer membrane biogenesis
MASLRNHPRLIGVATLVILAAAVAATLVLRFNPNAEKGRIIEAVHKATGRELVLAGPLHLTYGLHPVLEAEDVSFANAPGGSRPDMIRAARMEVQLALLPLLSRRVEIDHVTLVRPDILLETDAAGRGNWQFQRPAAPAAATSSSPAAPSGQRTAVALRSLRVESGRVTWRGRGGRIVTVDLPDARLDLGAGPSHLVADARVQDIPVKLEATLGTRAQLSEPGPWPIVLSATAGDATLRLDGTTGLPLRTHGYHGHVDLTAPDLAGVGTLLEGVGLLRTGLPALHDVRFGAMLGGQGLIPAPQDVTLHIGASSIDGVTLTRLDFTWPSATQAARLEADGAVAGAPWQLSSGVAPAGPGVSLRALRFASGFGDVAGDVALRFSGRPAIRGTLVSQRLNLDALPHLTPAAVAGPGPAAPSAVTPPATPPAAAAPSLLFPDTSLPWALLRRADLDLQVSVGDLVLRGADYRAASGHLVLEDGALHLDPFAVQAPEGPVGLSFSADAAQPEPPVALVLRSSAFALDPLLQAFGLPGGSDATLEVDVALHSTGRSPHALASHLDGHVGLALVDGELSNAVLATALGDVLRSARVGLDPAGRSHVRCFAVRLNAAQGQVSIAALKLDSTRLELEGSGTADLAAETLALRLRPLVRLGGAGILVPVRVDGALERPVAKLDSPDAAGRPGVVIGGTSGPADNCAAELTAARDGGPGPLPAEAPKKNGLKPADLLRSLLR